jgi:hypothetical protein
VWVLCGSQSEEAIIPVNINQLIFVTVKYVLFEVRPEFLNMTYFDELQL